MPHQEFDDQYRQQEVLLWAVKETDRYGQRRFNAAVAILVRWNDTNTKRVDADGNEVGYDATAVIGPDDAVGMDDLMQTSTNGSPTGPLFQVKMVKDTPDLKGRAVRRERGLMRYKDSVPSQAEA